VVEITCKCGYTWDYGGNKLYATCPRCHRKNRVPKLTMLERIQKAAVESYNKCIDARQAAEWAQQAVALELFNKNLPNLDEIEQAIVEVVTGLVLGFEVVITEYEKGKKEISWV